jgi:hypothetical protein
MGKRRFTWVWVALASTCCAGGYSYQGEVSNSSCPQHPAVLTGTRPAGAGCSQAIDCQPTCCTCSNNDGGQFLAAACDSASCASGTAACVGVESPFYCP